MFILILQSMKSKIRTLVVILSISTYKQPNLKYERNHKKKTIELQALLHILKLI